MLRAIKEKGYDKPSNLARKALFAYMARLPLKEENGAESVLHTRQGDINNKG